MAIRIFNYYCQILQSDSGCIKIFHYRNIVIVRRVVFRIKLFIVVYVIYVLILWIYVLLYIFNISTLLMRGSWRELLVLFNSFRHTFAIWLSKPQYLHFLPRAWQTWRCVEVQVWPQPLHWPVAARLNEILPDWFPKAFAPQNLLKDCMGLIAVPFVLLLLLLLLEDIRCWFWCPICIMTAMLRALSGSTVSRRSSRLISSSNIIVMKMSLIFTSSQLSKFQISANSFKML